MNKKLTNIKTEYFLIVNGVKQPFCFETKKEAINYARPHRRIIIFGSLYDKYLYYSQILRE